MKKIGFIGLGIMGKPMAQNLVKAGYELTVYDIVAERMEELVKAGARRGSSGKDVAARSEVVITMLPNSPHVREAVLGPNGVLEGAQPGTILVDMSSIAPLASQEIAAKVQAKGVAMLDAPVSGGEPKAIAGTLAIMVGGPGGDVRAGQGHPGGDGLFRHAGRRDRQRQRDETGQPDHRRAEHRRDVGGAWSWPPRPA